jgi:peptide deformylase
MAERPIRVFGDPVLKTPTERISEFDDTVRSLITDLLDTVAIPGRAGVAATQIGVGLSAFSFNIDGDVGYVINPVIEEMSGDLDLLEEGCLSVPGLWFPTPRYPYARVRGTDLDGKTVVVEGTGLMAQALQHETDHLGGLLYLNRLQSETRREAMRQVRESDWF